MSFIGKMVNKAPAKCGKCFGAGRYKRSGAGVNMAVVDCRRCGGRGVVGR